VLPRRTEFLPIVIGAPFTSPPINLGSGSCHAGVPGTSDSVDKLRFDDEILCFSWDTCHDAGVKKSGNHLDDISKAISEQLQQDGRRPYAAIGKVVGLSEAAVRQRVQRLIESGVMQVVAVTDPLQLGFARQAMIGIRVRGPVEQVADALSELDEVDYVVVTAGSYDLLVEAVCESDDALLNLISKSIRSIEGVETTETFMYLQLRKQTYSWGVR
jgi:Lrp/AsnC family transcriptional regulator for asnA, asnC and gidA